MSNQPPYPIPRFQDVGSIATTETLIPVTIHVTGRHAARLINSDYGRVVAEEMSPAERARALVQCVEARTLIDTTAADVDTVHKLLVADMGRNNIKPSTELEHPPSVFDDDKRQPMATVTGSD